MVDAAFFDIFGVIGFVILLWIGLKLSKYKLKHVKVIGYVITAIATVGLIVDIYNVLHKYIVPLFIKS